MLPYTSARVSCVLLRSSCSKRRRQPALPSRVSWGCFLCPIRAVWAGQSLVNFPPVGKDAPNARVDEATGNEDDLSPLYKTPPLCTRNTKSIEVLLSDTCTVSQPLGFSFTLAPLFWHE